MATVKTESGEVKVHIDAENSKAHISVESLRIEPAVNGGYAVSVNFRPEKPNKRDQMIGYIPAKAYAFSSLDELLTWQRTLLGKKAPKS